MISSLDEANRTLINNVRPAQWQNPTASGVYDLTAIGGGTAGLVCAAGAAALGARVALIERHMLGGNCLNTGCVPSKALLRSARVIGEMRRSQSLGVRVGPVDPDFAAIMQRMRERRAAISPHDSAQRLSSLQRRFRRAREARLWRESRYAIESPNHSRCPDVCPASTLPVWPIRSRRGRPSDSSVGRR